MTITAPSAGTVIVQANAVIQMPHTSGTSDQLQVWIGASATDCSGVYDRVIWETPSALPTYPAVQRTFTVRRAFPVAAGSSSFFLNGISNGTPGVNFYWGSMQAVFSR